MEAEGARGFKIGVGIAFQQQAGGRYCFHMTPCLDITVSLESLYPWDSRKKRVVAPIVGWSTEWSDVWRLNVLVRHLADAHSREGSSHRPCHPAHDNHAPHAIQACSCLLPPCPPESFFGIIGRCASCSEVKDGNEPRPFAYGLVIGCSVQPTLQKEGLLLIRSAYL